MCSPMGSKPTKVLFLGISFDRGDENERNAIRAVAVRSMPRAAP